MNDELYSPEETARRRFRQRVLIFLVALLAMTVVTLWYGPRAYSRWQQPRLTRQGREFLEKGDYRKAGLCLSEALRLNGGNIEASRAMAELAEKIHAPNAVLLRERVCRLQPGSLQDARDWASTALKFGDLRRAHQAFGLIRQIRPASAEAEEIEGRIEMAYGRVADATAHLSMAVRLDPTREDYKFQLAALEIQSPDARVRKEARAKLEDFRLRPHHRIAALRALLADSATRGPLENTLPLAEELAGDRDAGFQDQLLHLGIAHRAQHPSFSALLAASQERAQSNEQEVAQLLDWMKSHFLVKQALEWTKTLPPGTVSKPPVSLKLADLYDLLRDWNALQAFTTGGDWGQGEFLRHGFLARALLGTGDLEGAEKEWNSAVGLAKDRTPALTSLERTARAWGWDAKREELLWLIAERPEQPKWAFQALTGISQQQRDTGKLYRAWAKLFELNPADSLAKENWVVLSLLLRRNTAQAVKASRELYESRPSDAQVVVIHAFALHTQERTKESLALMRTLKPEQLREPSAAAYYGIFLAAEGDADAGKYLSLANEAALLPEEKQLVARARLTIGSR